MLSFCRPCFPAILFTFVLMLHAGVGTVWAQSKQLMAWEQDLSYLNGVSDEELNRQSPGIEQIRKGIELWIKMHPSSAVVLPPAPPKPWGVAELRKQVALLQEALQAIGREDADQPFDLGVTTVSVTSEASPLSLLAESIDKTEIQNLQALTVGTALDYLPGVSLDRISPRNEAGIRLRGYSNRGQIPLYLDGIPIQVAYDGSLDFHRFLTSDISEVQVAKGYSSPLLGPNNLGGSINLVTRQPEKKLEAEAALGTGSGETLLSSFHLGSRWNNFYFQGAFDWLQKDFIPLSGDFPLQSGATPSASIQTNYKKNNSDFRDAKYSGRIAWTPNESDQYVFSYVNQKGEKGNPIYSGPNENARLKFWDWPYWNKTSYYGLSNTDLGRSGSIKFRLFYDQFRNSLASYDDATHTTMIRPSSFYSTYDDHTLGGSSEFTTRIIPRNTMSASFFFKDDVHKEQDIVQNYTVEQPLLRDRNQTLSIGFQDGITVFSRMRATFGFSADYLKGMQAQARQGNAALVPLRCLSNPGNDSYKGCTPHVWTLNPQVSLSYSLTDVSTVFVMFSDRGRFATMMESYSYRLGRALPNPDLKPEHSRNWNVGFSHAFARNTLAQIEYFRSDLRDAIHSVYIYAPGLCPTNAGALTDYCSQNVNIADEMHEGFEITIRSNPVRRLKLDVSYSYLNRALSYEWDNMPDVSQLLTAVDVLPSLPRNKVVFNAVGELPREILVILSYRYEGGRTLQDITYNKVPPLESASHGIVDLGAVAPIASGVSLQAGVKNLFDRNYYYNAGFPEEGRNWYFNLRYRF